MEGFCRGCLKKYHDPVDLLQYCERNRRMFVYSTGLQVKRNDSFTFQLCKECYMNMKLSCKFKKQCRSSDRKFKNYLSHEEDDDTTDFSTYIKNTEDTPTLKFSTASGSSTPAHQKNKDDDNESTCTSFRNYITDILEGEEVPPTEAQIIHEVIQEEADILDDSLDSQWLQDDNMSVNSEFGMDFNFSSFSTPRHSVNNNHCYTPRKLTNEKVRELNYYTSKEIIDRPNDSEIVQSNDMPILDDMTFENITDNHAAIDHFQSKYSIDNVTEPIKQHTEQNHEDNSSKQTEITAETKTRRNFDDELFLPLEPLENDSNLYNVPSQEKLPNLTADEINISVILNKGVAGKKDIESPLSYDFENVFNKSLVKNMADFVNKSQTNNEIENTIHNMENVKSMEHDKLAFSEKAIDKSIDQSPFTQELEKYINKTKKRKEIENKIFDKYHTKNEKFFDDLTLNSELELYINKVESKQIHQKHKADNKNDCLIDRNLEMALKNESYKEFSLDKIILSPQESIKSGASTPTIRNILFGGMTPISKEPSIVPNIKLHANNEEVNTSDIIEEFLKNEPKSKQNKGKDIRVLEKALKYLDDSEIDDELMKTKVEFPEEMIVDRNIIDPNTEMEEDSQDLNISVSNLLDVGDNEVDLNLSIASDFLRDDDDFDHPVDNHDIDPFKKPLPPPDNQYDLDRCMCKMCDKTFTSSKALKIHFAKIHKFRIQRAVKVKKTVAKVCEYCGKAFRDASNLYKHVQKHSESIKDYQCNICLLNFATQSGLRLHMRIHVKDNSSRKKEKKYVCNICGKETRGLGNFKVHQRRHTKNFSVFCNECDQGFYRMTDLKVHMRIHSKEFPFACTYCPKAYNRRAPLRLHIMRHLGILNYECDICNVKFVSKYLIKQHFKSGSCLNNGLKSTRKENGANNNSVTVSHVVGSTKKIKEMMKGKKLPRHTNTPEVDKSGEISNSSLIESPVLNSKV